VPTTFIVGIVVGGLALVVIQIGTTPIPQRINPVAKTTRAKSQPTRRQPDANPTSIYLNIYLRNSKMMSIPFYPTALPVAENALNAYNHFLSTGTPAGGYSIISGMITSSSSVVLHFADVVAMSLLTQGGRLDRNDPESGVEPHAVQAGLEPADELR
jgi:hypothetical protein